MVLQVRTDSMLTSAFFFVCSIVSTCLCILEAWYYDQFSIRTAFTGEFLPEILKSFHPGVFSAHLGGLMLNHSFRVLLFSIWRKILQDVNITKVLRCLNVNY